MGDVGWKGRTRRDDPGRGLDPDTAAAVRELESVLGTRVAIRRRKEGSELVLFFYSEEELAALYDRLTRGD